MKGVVPDIGAIERLRIEAGLGWTELMARAHLSVRMIAKLRSGRSVRPRTLRGIARALRVPVARVTAVDASLSGEPASSTLGAADAGGGDGDVAARCANLGGLTGAARNDG